MRRKPLLPVVAICAQSFSCSRAWGRLLLPCLNPPFPAPRLGSLRGSIGRVYKSLRFLELPGTQRVIIRAVSLRPLSSVWDPRTRLTALTFRRAGGGEEGQALGLGLPAPATRRPPAHRVSSLSSTPSRHRTPPPTASQSWAYVHSLIHSVIHSTNVSCATPTCPFLGAGVQPEQDSFCSREADIARRETEGSNTSINTSSDGRSPLNFERMNEAGSTGVCLGSRQTRTPTLTLSFPRHGS